MKDLIKFKLNTLVSYICFGICLLISVTSFSQTEDRYTVVVNLYQPVSEEEGQLLEEILVTQIQFYLKSTTFWTDDKIQFKESPRKIISKLNDLVKADVKFNDYKALNDFKGFSGTALKKIENIISRNYDGSGTANVSSEKTKEFQLNHQLEELIQILKTELFVFGEKDSLEPTTEVYSDLTQEEKDQLIEEIENYQDGDMLSPISLTYETMKLDDDSGIFIGKPAEKDLADKILDILAENSQKLERLESELAQIKIEGVSSVATPISEDDREILDLLPEKMDFFFRIGSSRLTSATLLQLNEIVELLARGENIKVVITGYTDQSGNPSTNMTLSKKRAQAVKKFMEDSGMSEDRFIINYYGESKSDSINNQDRRVEIKFFI